MKTFDAVSALIHQAINHKIGMTDAKRAGEACRVLGLNLEEAHLIRRSLELDWGQNPDQFDIGFQAPTFLAELKTEPK